MSSSNDVVGGVPNGWRLVPVEPTPEMAKVSTWDMSSFYSASKVWAAMLAAAPAQPAAHGEFGDAYQGAREDLAIWKRRALEAEEKLRQQGSIIDHLTLEAQGETRMGEPHIAQGQQVEWRTTAVMLEQANAGLAQLNGKLRAELSALKAQQEPVAWRVTGAGGLTVTPEYPKWAEDDSRLLIESLYTAPQPALAQDVAGWIPVTERLPEVETDVLVRGVRRNEVMHRVAGLFNGEWSSQETEDLLLGEVTHWMPLPAAPALSADACNVDREDQWKLYSEDFVADVEAMLAAARAKLAAIQGGMGEVVGFDRNAAYAACPESGCDWGSFYVGWKAAAAQHQRTTAAMAAEVERWERSFRDIHEPALRDAHAYIQELRAELAISRADERCAMGYLSEVRSIVGGDDFPAMVERGRLMAAQLTELKASGWRNHSVNYARAEKCPQTLEAAQAAWDRDQELIEEQRAEIAKHKQTINQLRQRTPASLDVERLVRALTKTVAALDQLLPYLGKIPTDVGLLNDALVAARPLLEQNTNKEVTPDGK